MKRILLFFLIVCCVHHVQAQCQVSRDSLYRQLDAAIDSIDFFLQRKTMKIDSLKGGYLTLKTDMEKYRVAEQLYMEYEPFENDSAIAYQYRCIDLAEKMGRADLKARALVGLAYQLANSGFYNEARMHFDEVPANCLTGALYDHYLLGMNRMFGEMAYYSHDPRLSQQFHGRAYEIADQLLARLDTTSLAWLSLRSMTLNNKNQCDEAMRYNNLWMKACKPGSRQYAIMAFFRSEIYKRTGDMEQRRYWLVQAALVDIRNAIMDQGALWNLANTVIRQEGDLDRADRYVTFSWQCLSRFSTHMRAWLVAPVVTRINSEYREQLQTANNHLRFTIALISLMLIGMLLMLFNTIKKSRLLTLARNELQASNTRLSTANQLLSETNEQLRHAVIHLNDSNRVKDEYIGKFLSICSEYIEKLDNYRLKMNRKLKAKQYNDLMRLTSSEQLKEDEIKELFYNFDTVFLHLFPTFIDDFNALLRPEEKIVPANGHLLNTELRIFALIRLGIDESSKIARFLHYSPNSIYSYRGRIKNKAAVNRGDFEKLVKEIGIQK